MWISALLFFSLHSFAALNNLAQDPVWLRLLHFQGAQSEAEGLFLSPNGDHDPESELQATIQAFHQDKQTQCRFPARLIFLKTKLPQEKFPSMDCPEFQAWQGSIHATGIELIFASAFVNSPSSMYGHTMLKFPRGGKTAGNSLLDYTLSFGAETGDSSGFGYMWKGLMGKFRGYFATAPFYLKVLEYTQVENRDFWIYPIHLNSDQLNLLLAHVWELKNVGFRYYFLKKNCAYFLLELLEVVRPEQEFVSHFPLWSVPMDTIRILQKENLLGEPIFRPSRYETLSLARSKLNSAESVRAKELVDNPSAVVKADSANTIQAAYEFFRYRYGSRPDSAGKEAIQKKLLAALSTLSDITPVSVPVPPSPDTGHFSSRTFIAAGINRQNSYADFGYRGTLHDLLDDPVGYEDSSELTMGDFHGRVEAGSVFLEHSDILRIRSVPARDTWVPKTSWTVRLGSDRAKDFNCLAWHCFYGTLEGGPGISFDIPFSKLFLLAELESDVGASFSKHYRVGVGPSLGWEFTPTSWWRMLFEWDRRFDFWGESIGLNRLNAEQSWILKTNLEFRLRAELERGYREAQAGIYVLF